MNLRELWDWFRTGDPDWSVRQKRMNQRYNHFQNEQKLRRLIEQDIARYWDFRTQTFLTERPQEPPYCTADTCLAVHPCTGMCERHKHYAIVYDYTGKLGFGKKEQIHGTLENHL